jgi:hypothetical protein
VPVAAAVVEAAGGMVADAVVAGATLVEGARATAVVGVVATDVGAGEVAGAPVAPGTVDAANVAAVVTAVVTVVDDRPELHDDTIKTVTMSATAVVRM